MILTAIHIAIAAISIAFVTLADLSPVGAFIAGVLVTRGVDVVELWVKACRERRLP